MNDFVFENGELDGVVIIRPKWFEDARGVFVKAYEKDSYQQNGISFVMTETFRMISDKGVLRGIHLQEPHPQIRMVSVVAGEAILAVVDLRKDSETLGKSSMYQLDDVKKEIIYVPEGFGIGTYVLCDGTVIEINCSGEFFQECGTGIRYDDRDLNIPWPFDGKDSLVISEKDKALMTFQEFLNRRERNLFGEKINER